MDLKDVACERWICLCSLTIQTVLNHLPSTSISNGRPTFSPSNPIQFSGVFLWTDQYWPASLIRMLLVIAGIERNPGPIDNGVWYCVVCKLEIHPNRQPSVQCISCDGWVHYRKTINNCSNLKSTRKNDVTGFRCGLAGRNLTAFQHWCHRSLQSTKLVQLGPHSPTIFLVSWPPRPSSRRLRSEFCSSIAMASPRRSTTSLAS